MFRGPIQRANCAGSVHARNTASRGAARRRVMMSERSASRFSTVAGLAMRLLLPLMGSFEMFGETVEALAPEAPLIGEPAGGVVECARAQPAAPVLTVANAADERGALEHLEMARDRRQRDGEGRGELVDRALALHQAREDRPPRRIGKRGEGPVEIGSRHHLTYLLINIYVKYRTRRPTSSPFTKQFLFAAIGKFALAGFSTD